MFHDHIEGFYCPSCGAPSDRIQCVNSDHFRCLSTRCGASFDAGGRVFCTTQATYGRPEPRQRPRPIRRPEPGDKLLRAALRALAVVAPITAARLMKEWDA